MKLDDFKKELLKDSEVKKEFEKFDLAFEISQMLIEARVIRGVTQDKLARMIGTKQTSIARAESGKRLPSLSFLKKIADAFNTFLIPPKFGFMEEQPVKVQFKNNNTDIKDLHDDKRKYDKQFLYNQKSESYDQSYTFITK